MRSRTVAYFCGEWAAARIFLVTVDDRVQNLAEVVVRCYGLGAAFGTHHVRDGEAAQHLALADHLGLAVRPEEDEYGDEGQEDLSAQQPEEEEGDGEDLPYRGGYIRCPYRPEPGSEQAAQYPPPVHREGRQQVEDRERDVDVAQVREDLAHGTQSAEQVGQHEQIRPKQQGHDEEDRGENHVHQRTRDGYLDLVDRLLGQGLEAGETSYREQGYVRDLDAETLGHEGVAELV
jgi:hypothetical protein